MIIVSAIGIFCLLNGLAGTLNDTSAKTPKSLPATMAVSTRNTTHPDSKTLRVFLDRFGTVYFHHQPIDSAELIKKVQNQPSVKCVVVIYEPFSFHRDREHLQERLTSALPGRMVIMQALDGEQEYRGLAMPTNQPAIQSRVLSQQNNVDERFFERHLALIRQFQTQLSAARDQIARAGKEISTLYRERHHITIATQSSEKTSH